MIRQAIISQIERISFGMLGAIGLMLNIHSHPIVAGFVIMGVYLLLCTCFDMLDNKESGE